ncbi:HNH endonuclease [Alistipes indistinctus]|uniref:HNH endonuclease n=1 Tax=Alistipes indistinctus TaxID=626932 RepID=UPI0032C0DEB3
MMKVRDKLPVRRSNPSKNPSGHNWSAHKSDLKQDFHEHCAYCGSYDGFRHTYFEVDHFIPKELCERTGEIDLCQYDNLVYSCKFCNNNKLNKWPSNNTAISHVNNEGFVDPCSNDFDLHLYRTRNGSIRWHTQLGKWMVEVGFKFDQRDYAIRLLWELEKLKTAIDRLMTLSRKYSETSDEHKDIMANAGKYALAYFSCHNELMDYYNSI